MDIYIGWYIQLQSAKEKIDKHITNCNNSHCINKGTQLWGDNKFCPECGVKTEIKQTKTYEKDKYNQCDIERVFSKNYYRNKEKFTTHYPGVRRSYDYKSYFIFPSDSGQYLETNEERSFSITDKSELLIKFEKSCSEYKELLDQISDSKWEKIYGILTFKEDRNY